PRLFTKERLLLKNLRQKWFEQLGTISPVLLKVFDLFQKRTYDGTKERGISPTGIACLDTGPRIVDRRLEPLFVSAKGSTDEYAAAEESYDSGELHVHGLTGPFFARAEFR